MKKYCKTLLKDFILAILAGFTIGLGGLAFLSCDNKIVGSLFFTVGLFIVLAFDFNLFTGKICFSLENKPSYIGRLAVVWCGNFAGATGIGYLLSATKLINIQSKCIEIANAKLGDSFLSLFLLGILCNILIFIAVYGFKKFKEPWLRCLALFFGVSVFVLCGFEHCVADIFYFSFANVWSWDAFLRILTITAGNIVGGLFIPVIMMLIKRIKDVD